jgi:hypothetical protein
MNERRNRRYRDRKKLSAVASGGESPGHNIDTVLYHRQPSPAMVAADQEARRSK